MTEHEKLAEFLAHDPDNETLRLDCARAAIDAGAHEAVQDYLEPLLTSDHPAALGVSGLAALHRRDYETAETAFGSLMQAGQDDPGLRFNRAWSLAHLQRHEDALETLNADTVGTLPQAAMLHVQLLHQLGRFDDAANIAREHVTQFPDHEGLLASVSTLAMDQQDPDWARDLALKSPDHPQSQITLGSLSLIDGLSADAEQLFDKALLEEPGAPRALIGKGLARVLSGDLSAASSYLDKGAEQFKTHLGSWIAAGWIHAMNGDLETAKARFKQAESVDDTFSEVQGSLGVLDVLQGREDTGRTRLRAARRLDRNSPSAALGQMLILQAQDRSEDAQALFAKALETPINDQGTTLGQAMVQMGMGR
ncbi:MAG: tetratricopeptide repeat protein [Pseudomonadota bacterium]